MIMDCVVETLMKDPKASLRYYLPMIPMQALFLIGTRPDSLGFLGDFAFYNLMFQIFFHLQYILLTIEDLTGADEASSRFPGFDYILSTVPFVVFHAAKAFPELFGGMNPHDLVWLSALGLTAFAFLKMNYIVFSVLAQTFEKLNRPSYFFNLDKKALREA